MGVTQTTIKSIFGHAMGLSSAEERAAYLQQACAENPALQAEIESLLQADRDAGSFLGEREPRLVATVDDPVCERPGTVIGPYKLLEQIGEGGMGLVFVAEQQEPINRRVALKIIKPGMDTRQVIARFEAERQALALMDHPHIAKVHDGGTTSEGRPYFVMELVKGIPITDFCDQQRLNTRQRLQLFLDVCHAVQHAHQKGIIHRDLKPSNVLVEVHDVRPVVKVIDFGIAKATGQQLTDKTVYTGIAQMIGTPLYMSPEQAGLSSLDVDTRSDVYSLGVLLYELLTGTTPFYNYALQKAGYDEMRRIIREEEPPRPSTRLSTMGQAALSTIAERRGLEPRRLSQQLRGELDWIVMKALEKDRNRRYESTGTLAADVQRYLEDEPVLACPPSTLYRLGKLVRRHKAGLGVAAVLLLAVLLGASSLLWWLQKQAGAEGEARVAIQEANNHLEAERWSEALSAAKRAEGVLTGVGGDARLRQYIHELIAGLEMARKLQEAQLGMTAGKDGRFGYEAGAMAYAEAFREYGLDVDRLDPLAAAAQIQARPIYRRLVAAMDDWAFVLLRLEAQGWRQRLAVARAADPDEWRNRLRDWLEGKDPKAVEAIATADVGQELPVQTLALLGRFVSTTSSTERVTALLTRAQQQRPGDFWINQSLVENLHASRSRRLEEKIRFASVAVALQPQSPGAHNNLGIALWEKGQLDEAIAEYREAIRIKKDGFDAHNNLGIALEEKGQLDEAIAEYRDAIRLKKDNAGAHNNLGNVLRIKGQLDEAIAECREAIRLKKDNAGAHYNLGIILKEKGRLDEAIAEYREAIRIKKDYPEAHNNLGIVLQDKGRLDEAIAEYREALKNDFPEAYKAHRNLGIVLQDKGRLDEAIAEYRQASRLKNDFAEAHNRLSDSLRKKGLLDEAIAESREAIRLKKDFAGAHHNLGNALYAKGQLDEAMTECREAIRLKKDDAKAHNSLGVILFEKGLPDEAIAEFREAIRIEKDYALPHCCLGSALATRGRLDEAIAEYREAIRIQKDLAEAHSGLGRALLIKGQLDEAIGKCREAIRLNAGRIEAHMILALAFQQKGEFRMAQEELRRATELSDANPRWRQAAVSALQKNQRFIELEPRLPRFLQGEEQPADVGERLTLADLCTKKKLYVASARCYAEAFGDRPSLADDLDSGNRYNAACAAALAGCGQGKDTASLGNKERDQLRQKTLGWLKDDLHAWQQLLEKASERTGPMVGRKMNHWLQDPDFNGVRGAQALSRLPEAERQAWQQLWADVADTLAKCQGNVTPKKKPETK